MDNKKNLDDKTLENVAGGAGIRSDLAAGLADTAGLADNAKLAMKTGLSEAAGLADAAGKALKSGLKDAATLVNKAVLSKDDDKKLS